MTNMSIQPLWLTYFIEILLVLEFQLTKNYFGMFSYKAHFRPQISSNNLKLLSDDSSESVDAMMYHHMIGSLMYLMNTRPDIWFFVNTLS